MVHKFPIEPLLSFIGIAVPFIATLFSSDLCIYQYLPSGTPEKISIQYSYSLCIEFYDGSCFPSSIVDIPSSLEFQPPPVYSGQCRNAVLQNYLPLVIYACAFQAFANPVIYFLFTYNLNAWTYFYMFSFTLRPASLLRPPKAGLQGPWAQGPKSYGNMLG